MVFRDMLVGPNTSSLAIIMFSFSIMEEQSSIVSGMCIVLQSI